MSYGWRHGFPFILPEDAGDAYEIRTYTLPHDDAAARMVRPWLELSGLLVCPKYLKAGIHGNNKLVS